MTDVDKARRQGLDRYAAFFADLTSQSLEDLRELVTGEVRFRDPFNDVRGPDAMIRIFRKMYEDVEAPRFDVLSTVLDGETGYLKWRMTCRHGLLGALDFVGVSELVLAADGRVASHVDYWDPAAAIYEKVPLVGRIVRALSRRLQAG